MAERVYDVRPSRLSPNRYKLTPRPKGERVQGRPPTGEVWAKRVKYGWFVLVDSQGEDYAAEIRDKQVCCPRCGRVMQFSHTFALPRCLPAFFCEKCVVDAQNDPYSAL
ncbi:MAG: hypothetical protein LUE89_09530 [Clostridiales bacterium]|nr:hypothetical protein [Clostridiales bacterium]